MTIDQQPTLLFLSYVQEDEAHLRQLEIHLRPLVRQGLCSIWHKRQIPPGASTSGLIDQQIEQAALILLLISPDFLASDYYHEREMQKALKRHEDGTARVVPLLVRPSIWQTLPLASLPPLPSNGKPITSWHNPDEAWTEVVEGIRALLSRPLNAQTAQTDPSPASPPLTVQERLLEEATFGAAFPPVWQIPHRLMPFFTGRDQLIEQLFDRFTAVPAHGHIPIQALTGLAGLGKTQTAVAYAFRYRQHYQHVLWLNAETEETLLAGFTRFFQLRGPALPSRTALLEQLQNWFLRTRDWLLILDNADDLASIEPFLPLATTGHLLLTTRASAMEGLATSLVLTSLEPEAGALCLFRRANYLVGHADLSDPSLSLPARKAALELSELMGGLPLALEQAGAYLDMTGRSVSEYLQLYQHYRPELQQNLYGSLAYYRTAVAFAWTLARDRVSEQSPAAIELLALCAFLAPDSIPFLLFTNDTRLLGPVLGPVVARPPAFNTLLALLRRHSLLKNEVERETDISRLFIHRVLQEVLRDEMDRRTQQRWAERAVRVVAHALPLLERPIVQSHARVCLRHIEQWKMRFREADLIRTYLT